MKQTIEVLISPKGEIKIQTKGFAGSSCQAASKFLEDALGAKLSDQPTAELYQTQPTTQQIQQKGNS
jgi:Protein of unknown function (DUF2997).